MKTYFIRHSSKLDIDQNTMNLLWKENKVGIHYPSDKNGELRKSDSQSLNPEDYAKNAKSKMKILIELAKNGGYVYSVYRDIDEIKIGIVPPNSQIDLFKGKWGNKNNHQNREAILKVIKLKKVKNLSKEDSISLNSIQPQQGTICVWKKAGTRVLDIVENNSKQKSLNNLTPDQQEVMCMEFMRLPIVKEEGLPQISVTLTPVGRTMKDVDIYALSTNKKQIICQVTFYSLNNNKAQKKLNILNEYEKNKKEN